MIWHCDSANCHKSFDTLAALNRHKRLVHAKRYRCDCVECKDKLFATKWHLVRHQRTHVTRTKQWDMNHQAKAMRHTCKYCHKDLGDKYSLKKHIQLMHKSCAKQYICRRCKKRHATKAALKQHIQTHLHRQQRTLYPCDQCDVVFTIKSNR
eukprot:546996_1